VNCCLSDRMKWSRLPKWLLAAAGDLLNGSNGSKRPIVQSLQN
jgi:hypothetical protein